jgi:hypothetical protein
MSNEFTSYAPPLVYGAWTEAIGGLARRSRIRIKVNPVGETTIFGEVRYFDSTNSKVTQEFQGTALIETSDGLQNVEVRFKGVPTGSAVEGSWAS